MGPTAACRGVSRDVPQSPPRDPTRGCGSRKPGNRRHRGHAVVPATTSVLATLEPETLTTGVAPPRSAES